MTAGGCAPRISESVHTYEICGVCVCVTEPIESHFFPDQIHWVSWPRLTNVSIGLITVTQQYGGLVHRFTVVSAFNQLYWSIRGPTGRRTLTLCECFFGPIIQRLISSQIFSYPWEVNRWRHDDAAFRFTFWELIWVASPIHKNRVENDLIK